MRLPLAVPPRLTPQLERALDEANLTTPIYVDRVDRLGSLQGSCLRNCLNAVEEEGGFAVYGWAVRVWPRAFLEAEQHVIWQRGDGTKVDVSPHPRDSNTLFAEDELSEFTKDGFAKHPNRYLNLGIGRVHPIVRRLISVSLRKQEYELKHK